MSSSPLIKCIAHAEQLIHRFVVEKIVSHLVDEVSGELRFEVKWEGYEKKSDRTWEPEENL